MATLSVFKAGLNAAFNKAMGVEGAKDFNDQSPMTLFFKLKSKTAKVDAGWLGSIDTVRELIGEATFKELKDYNYTIGAKDFYTGVTIPQNDIDDDQSDSYRSRVADIPRKLAQYPVRFASLLLESGTTGLAYDGKPFFSNTRKNVNLIAGTGVTLAQVEADLETADRQFATFKNDSGDLVDIVPDTIYCPVALERTFKKLINSTNSATDSNSSVYNPWKGSYDIIVDRRLTDVNDWYLASTKSGVKPLIFNERAKAKPFMERKSGTDTWDFWGKARYDGAYGVPEAIIKITNS